MNDSDSLVATCWRNEGTHRLLKEAEILNQSFCAQLQDLIHWDEYFGVCIVVPGVNPGLPGLRNQTSPTFCHQPLGLTIFFQQIKEINFYLIQLISLYTPIVSLLHQFLYSPFLWPHMVSLYAEVEINFKYQ